MTMRFAGVPGQRYQVLTTTNLVWWGLWKDFTGDGESLEMAAPNVTGEPMRFFKLVMP